MRKDGYPTSLCNGLEHLSGGEILAQERYTPHQYVHTVARVTVFNPWNDECLGGTYLSTGMTKGGVTRWRKTAVMFSHHDNAEAATAKAASKRVERPFSVIRPRGVNVTDSNDFHVTNGSF
jgi:hypothetical protein